MSGGSPIATFPASLWRIVLGSLAEVHVKGCPHCADNARPHWIKWGFYERYAKGKRERIRVQRYQCKRTRRTFSVLPDGLVPYHFARATTILSRLDSMVVEEKPTLACAKRWNAARSTLRRLKDSFLRTVPLLRLPQQEGALGPREFLVHLAKQGVEGVASLFRGWKEQKPKLTIVGIYAR